MKASAIWIAAVCNDLGLMHMGDECLCMADCLLSGSVASSHGSVFSLIKQEGSMPTL